MEKFKELRKKAGFTQQSLADATGMVQSKIGRIENGNIDIGNISLKSAYKLSKALGVSMEDLLPDEYKTISELSQSHEDMKESREADTKPSLTPEQLQEIAMKAVQDALANTNK